MGCYALLSDSAFCSRGATVAAFIHESFGFIIDRRNRVGFATLQKKNICYQYLNYYIGSIVTNPAT